MPPQLTVPEIRSKNILTALTAAADTFKVVATTLRAPFLQVISSTLISLLNVVQVGVCNDCIVAALTKSWQPLKKNRDDCTHMLEQVHKILYAIINLHLKSDTHGELSPDMLYNLGKFTE